MIICPNCKEEIDSDSHYCDQCGHALLYCSSCGRVGLGRRCTYCGGLMMDMVELQRQREDKADLAAMTSASMSFATHMTVDPFAQGPMDAQMPKGMPMLTLFNQSLDIRIVGINGAVIGRRQGPYSQFFASNMYVSGVHAQLIYKSDTGWSIIDKHSSNGTMLNQRPLHPDVPMTISNGDILSIANVNLQVLIK